MPIPIVRPAPLRERGNPNWGKPMQPAPAIATEFELADPSVGTHEANVCCVSSVARLVRVQQESLLHPRMVSC